MKEFDPADENNLELNNEKIFKAIEMFNLIGIGEHAGSGVPDIFDIWDNEGLETPGVEEQFGVGIPDRTTLILPLSRKEQEITGPKQDFLQNKS